MNLPASRFRLHIKYQRIGRRAKSGRSFPHSSAEPSAASAKFDTAIHYSLALRPPHGALLRIKTVNSSEFVTELAIFSNGFPCGILQTIGTENGPDGLRFGNTYQLYIPPEFLQSGDNILRIQKLGHPYNRANRLGLSITLDWLELIQLSSAPVEPIHSRYVRIGTNWGLFPVDDITVACEPLTWLWTGTAYTNGAVRVCFWCDQADTVITRPKELLAAAKDYNMTVVLDYSNCSPEALRGHPIGLMTRASFPIIGKRSWIRSWPTMVP